MIARQEYLDRMTRLQQQITAHGLDAFLVSAEESIYYLTGVSYWPLERPFFIVVRPGTPATLVTPALDGEHLRQAPNVGQVRTYWDYPSPPRPQAQGWAEQLAEAVGSVSKLGVEPSLPQEIATRLPTPMPQVMPLVEQLRLVKSPAEVEMLRHAAHYADLSIEKVLAVSYYGVSDLELFSQGRAVQMQIMKDTDYGVLTTSVLVGAWPVPLSAQPHGVPKLKDRLKDGPHIALSLLRVNGYAAECERTYFLAPPTNDVTDAFVAMQEVRRRAFALVQPGARCADIDAAANGYLREQGYGDHLLHRTGPGEGCPLFLAPGCSTQWRSADSIGQI